MRDNEYDESKLDKLHKGLLMIRDMAMLDRENRMGLLKIRYENESLDVIRAYQHFFLKHTKTKTEMKRWIGEKKIGEIFTVYDEGLVILLMMNNWTTWEILSKGKRTAREIGNRYRLYTKAEDGSQVNKKDEDREAEVVDEDCGEDESVVVNEKRTRKVQYRGWSKEGISVYNKIVERMMRMKIKEVVCKRQIELESELFEEMKEKYGNKKGKGVYDDSDSDDDEVMQNCVAHSGFLELSPDASYTKCVVDEESEDEGNKSGDVNNLQNFTEL